MADRQVSRSAGIHREALPYCHPIVAEFPPSRAARLLAQRYTGDVGKTRSIVDAGCGEGRDTQFLLAEGLRVIAVDASRRNLKVVSGAAAQAGIASSMFACCLADLVQGIPVQSATVDAVLDVWVLGSVILHHDGRDGAKRYLAEVCRVLRPSGLFVCEFETLRPRRPPAKLEEYLSRLLGTAFQLVETKPILAEYVHYVQSPRQRSGQTSPALLAVASRTR
jgi:SAM-dependent methyltransferase